MHLTDVGAARTNVWATLSALGWGSTIVAAALWLKHAPPAAGSWLARATASEGAHIVAHVFLYGVLAALARVATRRVWASALIVAAFAIAQEAAQSWGRAFGGAEWFDLGVDTLAAAVVLAIVRRRG